MPNVEKDIQKMRLAVKQIKTVVLAMLIVLMVITPAIDAQAATGDAMIVATVGELEEGSVEEVLERNEYLANSYKQLEEKYQREKDFSRSVIYVLIFVIAILIVLLINVIALSFRKVDDDFEESFKKSKAPKKEPAQRAVKPAPKQEKATPKPEKPASKAEIRKNFEVFDFNDEE